MMAPHGCGTTSLATVLAAFNCVDSGGAFVVPAGLASSDLMALHPLSNSKERQ